MDQKMENSKVKTLMDKYELGKFLGQGTFAKVYQARNIQTGHSVAIKVIDKEKVYKVGMVDQIKRQISVMRLVRHPNVVELYEVMATKGKIYIVMEYVKGGELFSKVAKGKLSEDVARKYFQQLISAIDYCHSKGVYHRDLKPENLLLDENENLKVTDFGLSAVSSCKRQDGLLHTSCGTPSYVAPEVIFRKGYDGATADIWSCGVILFVLLAGYLPFQDSNLMEMYKKIGKAEFKFPSWFSPEVRRMLAKILRPKPDKRSSIEKIMDSSWFKKGGYGQRLVKPNIAKSDEPVVVPPPDSESVEKPVMVEELPKQQQVFAKRCYSMNAFDIIALSKGLDLSGLFREKRQDKVERFSVLEATASSVTSKLEDVARMLRMKVKKMDGGWMKFEGMKKRGSKGTVSIEVEIFELTSAFQMVEMKMSSGDTMEYEKIMKEDIRPALKDAISWTWLGDEQQSTGPSRALDRAALNDAISWTCLGDEPQSTVQVEH